MFTEDLHQLPESPLFRVQPAIVSRTWLDVILQVDILRKFLEAGYGAASRKKPELATGNVCCSRLFRCDRNLNSREALAPMLPIQLVPNHVAVVAIVDSLG